MMDEEYDDDDDDDDDADDDDDDFNGLMIGCRDASHRGEMTTPGPAAKFVGSRINLWIILLMSNRMIRMIHFNTNDYDLNMIHCYSLKHLDASSSSAAAESAP